jgi:hypothetical protein
VTLITEKIFIALSGMLLEKKLYFVLNRGYLVFDLIFNFLFEHFFHIDGTLRIDHGLIRVLLFFFINIWC